MNIYGFSDCVVNERKVVQGQRFSLLFVHFDLCQLDKKHTDNFASTTQPDRHS